MTRPTPQARAYAAAELRRMAKRQLAIKRAAEMFGERFDTVVKCRKDFARECLDRARELTRAKKRGR